MKKTSLLIGAFGALTLLSACGGGYYGAAYGGPDVYYDGAYGPYVDGYWADDGFYYRGGDGRYVHDDANHFRRQQFNGARGFHSGHAPAAGALHEGGHEGGGDRR